MLSWHGVSPTAMSPAFRPGSSNPSLGSKAAAFDPSGGPGESGGGLSPNERPRHNAIALAKRREKIGQEERSTTSLRRTRGRLQGGRWRRFRSLSNGCPGVHDEVTNIRHPNLFPSLSIVSNASCISTPNPMASTAKLFRLFAKILSASALSIPAAVKP